VRAARASIARSQMDCRSIVCATRDAENIQCKASVKAVAPRNLGYGFDCRPTRP
jgi:hypothetical protein